MTEPPRFESGGGGLLSTIGDYARFLAMLSSGGALDGAAHPWPADDPVHGERSSGTGRGPEYATCSAPGHGFGLGFGVRLQYGLAPTPGSVGDYFWGGWAGTTFRISPQDSLFAILMVQAPDYRVHLNQTFANLYTAALV